MGGGDGSFTGQRMRKTTISLKGSLTPEKVKGGGEELLLQRRVPGRSNDEAPKHSPSSGPSASHLWQVALVAAPAPRNLAAVLMFLEMSPEMEAIARNK